MPQGLDAKARLATGFLKRRLAEYNALKVEIERLTAELSYDQKTGA